MDHRCQVTINFKIDAERAEAALRCDPVYPRVLIEIPFNIIGQGADKQIDLMVSEALISLKIEQPGIPEGTVFTSLEMKSPVQMAANGHGPSSAETSPISDPMGSGEDRVADTPPPSQ